MGATFMSGVRADPRRAAVEESGGTRGGRHGLHTHVRWGYCIQPCSPIGGTCLRRHLPHAHCLPHAALHALVHAKVYVIDLARVRRKFERGHLTLAHATLTRTPPQHVLIRTCPPQVKLPCTLEGIQTAALLRDAEIRVTITGLLALLMRAKRLDVVTSEGSTRTRGGCERRL